MIKKLIPATLSVIITGCSISSEQVADFYKSRHKVDTVCTDNNLTCSLTSELYGEIKYTCIPESNTFQSQPTGQFATSKFKGEHGFLNYDMSNENHRYKIFELLLNDKSVTFAPQKKEKLFGLIEKTPRYLEINYNKEQIKNFHKNCINQTNEIERRNQQERRHEARQIALTKEQRARDELNKIASKHKVTSYSHNIRLIELVMNKNLLDNKNKAFITEGSILYKVKQSLPNNSYLIIAEDPWVAINTMPLLIKSKRTLYEGHHLSDFIGIYNGVTTYRTVTGATKQAAKITLIKPIQEE